MKENQTPPPPPAGVCYDCLLDTQSTVPHVEFTTTSRPPCVLHAELFLNLALGKIPFTYFPLCQRHLGDQTN